MSTWHTNLENNMSFIVSQFILQHIFTRFCAFNIENTNSTSCHQLVVPRIKRIYLGIIRWACFRKCASCVGHWNGFWVSKQSYALALGPFTRTIVSGCAFEMTIQKTSWQKKKKKTSHRIASHSPYHGAWTGTTGIEDFA